MQQITNTEQADAQAKKLIPTSTSTEEGRIVEATVLTEPVTYDSKLFWRISYVDSETKEPVRTIGGVSFIADNGKLINLSSNYGIHHPDNYEEFLLDEYAK